MIGLDSLSLAIVAGAASICVAIAYLRRSRVLEATLSRQKARYKRAPLPRVRGL